MFILFQVILMYLPSSKIIKAMCKNPDPSSLHLKDVYPLRSSIERKCYINLEKNCKSI